jgi:exopolysaccharide biosynthesis protein
MNWFNGDLKTFNKRFGLAGGDPPINNDQHIQTHSGVTCHIVNRFGAKCVVQVINPRVVEVYVTGTGFATVGDAVRHFRADGGINGGGWPNAQSELYRSNEIWVSEGNYLQTRAIDNRGFMNVSQFGQAEIRETDADISKLWNAWGFDRILGSNGMFNPKIADRTTKDARTGAGITADGKVVLLSAEGNDRFNVGLTFPEMWAVLFEFGAMIAGNNDGGSSSACWNTAVDNTKSLIVPSDGSEARVINHVLFFASGETIPPDPGESIMPVVKGTANKGSAVNIKTISGIPAGVIATIPVLGWCYGDDGTTDVLKLRSADGTQKGFYRPSGEFVPLAYDCKASKTNMTVTPYVIPDPDPDPDPEPTPDNDLVVTASVVNGMPTIIITGANGVASVTVDGVTYIKRP